MGGEVLIFSFILNVPFLFRFLVTYGHMTCRKFVSLLLKSKSVNKDLRFAVMNELSIPLPLCCHYCYQ